MKKIITLILAALTCLCFAACAPADADKAKTKMEKAGYSVTVADEESTELFVGEEGVSMITATKTEGGLLNLKTYMVSAVLFDSAAAAKKYYEETFKEEDQEEGIVYKRSGKWIINGDEESVKAFMK